MNSQTANLVGKIGFSKKPPQIIRECIQLQVPPLLLSIVVYKYKCGRSVTSHILVTRFVIPLHVFLSLGGYLSVLVSGLQRLVIVGFGSTVIKPHGFCNENVTVLRVSNEFDFESCEKLYIHQIHPVFTSMNSSSPMNTLC